MGSRRTGLMVRLLAGLNACRRWFASPFDTTRPLDITCVAGSFEAWVAADERSATTGSEDLPERQARVRATTATVADAPATAQRHQARSGTCARSARKFARMRSSSPAMGSTDVYFAR